MATNDDWFFNAVTDAFAQSVKASQGVAAGFKSTTDAVGATLGKNLYKFVEQGTESIGNVVTPIATHPLVRFATKVPGVNWLMAALGQVDVETVKQEVEKLRLQYPLDDEARLVERVILDTVQKAAMVGLVTNVIPPVALALFAVDLGAIAALQAKMIYQIAAIYGFSPTDATRRGEVLALWGLSSSSSGVMKSGLSIVELLPGIGAVVGVTTDAALISGMGYLACNFYQAKRNDIQQQAQQESSGTGSV